MVDIASFTKSLKTAWIKKYLDDSNLGKWKDFFELELRKYGGKLIFTCNLNKVDTSKLIVVQVRIYWKNKKPDRGVAFLIFFLFTYCYH